ncbi:MAG: thioredoxin domain-containing protein [Alphaproteobacteria bacterium]|nr:thioredoxin domain-containing protein [Alphaproteobacteria bacterium]MBV9063487.1 thioredoxin domain-containing protein [Alphaproteobacteria bacterium]
MKSPLIVALAGAIGGAALAVAVLFAAAAFGVFPPGNDARIHGYLTSHPELLAEMSNRLQAQQEDRDDAARQVAVQKLGRAAFFNPRLAFMFGPKNARATFVEFFDYNCPYCRASLPAVKKFIANHQKDTRFAFIEFPIKGPRSTIAARAAIAARKQPDKYLAFHFRLMDEKALVTEDVVYADAAKSGLDIAKLKADMEGEDVDAAISAAHNLAIAANIDGTPAFIINGRAHEGALDDADLRKLLTAS